MAGRPDGACALAGIADVVDGLVIVIALLRGDVVFTSDPDDLGVIAEALNVQVRLHRV